jgi:hypothetical protein
MPTSLYALLSSTILSCNFDLVPISLYGTMVAAWSLSSSTPSGALRHDWPRLLGPSSSFPFELAANGTCLCFLVLGLTPTSLVLRCGTTTLALAR